MTDLEQQAIDYSLGLLPRKDSKLFEAMIKKVPEAQQAFAKAQDELSLIGLTSRPKEPSLDLRNRVLEISEMPSTSPNLDFRQQVPPVSATATKRYNGGGGSVDLSDLAKIDYKDQVNRLYEGLLKLTPLVAGNSSAADGNLTELKSNLNSISLVFPEQGAFSANGISENPQQPPAQSLLRSYLTSLPSMGFFIERIKAGKGTVGDIRRLFYLCRDQKKIMRASFGDLDAARLAEDEELRLHGAGLLKTKWWGAEHSYFNDPGKVRCGHFFDGPVTERCVEFAEYDSNLYCLANLLAAHSSEGQFSIEIHKDVIPHGVLALVASETSETSHSSLLKAFGLETPPNDKVEEVNYLVQLVMNSVCRAHTLKNPSESLSRKLMGCDRRINQSYLWFTWPEITEPADPS